MKDLITGEGLKPELLDELGHQRAVLRVLLGLTIPAGIGFAAINLFRGSYILAFIEMLFSLAAAITWRRVPAVEHVRPIVALFSIPMILVACYVMVQPHASSTMFAWIFSVPVLLYSSLGTRHGFQLTSIFYLFVGGLFALKHVDGGTFHDVSAAMNLSVCSLAVWGFVHAYEKARSETHKRLANFAITDPLTGLYNRLSLESAFERRKVISEEEGLTMGLIMVDLDHFKAVNDKFGHDGGDIVLREVAETLTNAVRAEDHIFRMGGEEFCLVVPRIGKSQLACTAEALRVRIENLDIDFEGERIRVTTSIGAVMMDEKIQDLDTLLSEADKRLYQAKNRGRNQVVFEEAV